MKYLFITLLFTIGLWAVEPSQEEWRDISTVEQILSAKEPWPGYKIAQEPNIITFSSGQIFAFNLNSDNPVWKNATINGRSVQYTDQDEWGVLQTPMQANFPVDGKQAFVYKLDHLTNEGPQKPFMVFVHERYHQFQYAAFSPVRGGYADAYEDHLNGENLALMQLEEKILIDYFKTGSRETLKEFTAVSHLRRSKIRDESVRHENVQQILEGMADYVSIKIFDQTPVLEGFSGKDVLRGTLENYASHPDIAQRAMKWRHYGIGSAIGYLLDDLQVPNWKEKVQSGSDHLIGLLEKAVPLSPEERKRLVAQAKAKYDHDKTYSQTIEVVNAAQSYLQSLFEDYNAQPGTTVSVGRLRSAGQSGGGQVQKMIYLANGSILALNDDSAAASSDQAWNLRLEKVPYVFKGRAGEIAFKVENELVIEVDGKPVKVTDLKECRFKKIAWKGVNTAFSCVDRPGKVALVNGAVVIDFD